MTRVLQIDPDRPQSESIEAAAEVIRSGGLVAFPTETVYGLGANALDPDAVRRIYVAKGRPANNPIIVHVQNALAARQLAAIWPQSAEALAERFWPGPLTLVVPRSTTVPDIVAAGGSSVALRCPKHAVALALLQAAGVPIAAPSANRSSELSPTRPEHVLHGLDGLFDLLLDAGPTPAGIESTIVDLSGRAPRLLRPGPIPPLQLEELLGTIDRTSISIDSGAMPLPSPGLMSRHYSPRTPLECWSTMAEVCQRVRDLVAENKSVTVIATEDPNLGDQASTIVLPAAPEEYAAEIYSVLHELDRARPDRILVLLPPPKDEWLAVRDRLMRAASPK